LSDAGIGCAVVTVAALLNGSPQQHQGLAFAAAATEALGAGMLQINVAAPTPPRNPPRWSRPARRWTEPVSGWRSNICRPGR
jgi:hypothetical protein